MYLVQRELKSYCRAVGLGGFRMTQRKELRLFFIVAMLLILVIGVRYITQAMLGRGQVEWVALPTSGVVQAAPVSAVSKSQAAFEQKAYKETINYDGSQPAAEVTPNSISVTVDTPVVDEIAGRTSADSVAIDYEVAGQGDNEQATCSLSNGAIGLDLNKANAEQLDELPGIGPSIAGAILQERVRRGRYSAVNELLDVKGIGPSRLERLSEFVCVDGSHAMP
jgi:competence ComEA-like helix-hairpin-helix protein